MSTVADLLLTLVHLAVTGAVLLTARRIHHLDLERRREAGEEAPPQSPAVSAVVAAAGAVVAAAALLLLGYVALALLLARRLTWLPLIAASLYLLLPFADDACTTLFSPTNFLGRAFGAVLAAALAELRPPPS